MITKAIQQAPKNNSRGLKMFLALIFAGVFCFALYGSMQAQTEVQIGTPNNIENGSPIFSGANLISTTPGPNPVYILSNNQVPINIHGFSVAPSSQLFLGSINGNMNFRPAPASGPPFGLIPTSYSSSASLIPMSFGAPKVSYCQYYQHTYDIGCIGNTIIKVKDTKH
jgi:hypothetical protein